MKRVTKPPGILADKRPILEGTQSGKERCEFYHHHRHHRTHHPRPPSPNTTTIITTTEHHYHHRRPSTTMPSNTPVKVLFTGATGYVGGAILDRLLVHAQRDSFEITSFSRDATKAQALEAQFGVKSVLGSLSDVQKLEDLAAGADIVLNTAASDDLPVIQAILRGLKRRHTATGETPAFIHTVSIGLHYGRGRTLTHPDSPALRSCSTMPMGCTTNTSSTTTRTSSRSSRSLKTHCTAISTSRSSPRTEKVSSLSPY